MKCNPQFQLKGFTLIEVMLVILLMSGLALMATVFLDNAEQQMGYDQTKARLEQIRRAIIGDSSRTLNGQPEISGFVADMGALPTNLRDLVEMPESATPWGPKDITIESDVVGQFYGGWRGPYLDAMPESQSGKRTYRDGWNNKAEDLVEDGKQYGWVFRKEGDDPDTADIDESTHVFMQSLGGDFLPDESAPPENLDNDYFRDYPVDGQNLIHETDWRINLRNQEFKVVVNRNTTGEHTLRLQIFSLRGNSAQSLVDVALGTTTMDMTSQEFTGIFPNTDDIFLTTGTHAAVVVCIPILPAAPHPYDGDCSKDGTAPQPQYFQIIPRSHRPPLQLEWNTQ